MDKRDDIIEKVKDYQDLVKKSDFPMPIEAVYLFGSYAKGTASADSDIDLMVILDNDHVSKTYQERLDKKLDVHRLVREINYKIALDILVYSKEEYKMVKDYGNYFIDEIERTGKTIYEKSNS
jgi:predicted nucleotidyltransferase